MTEHQDVDERRGKPRLIVNAGDIRDIWRHMQDDMPMTLRLNNGQEIDVVAGDPLSGEIGNQFAEMDAVEVRGTTL